MCHIYGFRYKCGHLTSTYDFGRGAQYIIPCPPQLENPRGPCINCFGNVVDIVQGPPLEERLIERNRNCHRQGRCRNLFAADETLEREWALALNSVNGDTKARVAAVYWEYTQRDLRMLEHIAHHRPELREEYPHGRPEFEIDGRLSTKWVCR